MSAQAIDVALRLQAAWDTRDFAAYTAVLADDVQWRAASGEPGICHDKAEVLARLRQALDDERVDADLTDIVVTGDRLLLATRLRWPDGREHTLHQVFTVRGGKVVDMQDCADRADAVRFAGGSP